MTTQPIYRFKFSAECQLALEIFANTHRYDEISNFREKWKDWYRANANIIAVEETRLKALGCVFLMSMPEKILDTHPTFLLWLKE